MTDIHVVRDNTSAVVAPLHAVPELLLPREALSLRACVPGTAEPSFGSEVFEVPSIDAANDAGPAPLVLDLQRRVLEGVGMLPLVNGELALVRYLGSRPGTWHSSYKLALHVYQREDVCARQLVWKYMSTLRKKLAGAAPDLMAVCRRRGYSWHVPVVVNEPAPALA